jgi:hypothetical protein
MKKRERVGVKKKAAATKGNLSYQKRLRMGFAKVESDLQWLMESFCELLFDLGEEAVVDALPFRGSGKRELPKIEKGKVNTYKYNFDGYNEDGKKYIETPKSTT